MAAVALLVGFACPVAVASAEVTIKSPGSVVGGTPYFEGTATGLSMVCVYVEQPPHAAVKVAEAMGTGGNWISGKASPALEDGKYIAFAEQENSVLPCFGEASSTVEFTVNAASPTVTLNAPQPSINTTPSFSGKATDHTAVTVHIYAAGQEVAKATAAPPSNESWSSGPASPALAVGEYTAVATQPSSLENPEGRSNEVRFSVTPPPSGPSPPFPLAPSFTWFPSAPHTGETVSLVSTSTDTTNAILGYAWAPTGNGVFQAGKPTLTTSFTTPGNHVVQLRVTDDAGYSAVATEAIPVTSAPLVLMEPFPVVRFAGSDTSFGVRLSVLTVQAPAGAIVTVTCKGHGCPVKSQSQMAVSSKKSAEVTVAFRKFQRSLRAGIVLEIRIFKAGEIGKYTRFQVRKGKLPLRTDTCLGPAGGKPIACPT